MWMSDHARGWTPKAYALRAVTAGMVLLAGIAACTSTNGPATTGLPSTGPTGGSVDASAPSIPERTPVALTVASGTDAGSAAGRSLNVPRGWSAQVWANVPGARLATWTPDGRLLVSTGGRGEVSMLTPTTAGSAPTITTLLAGLSDPQGLAFAEQDGQPVLVVGEGPRIVAWDYSAGAVSHRRVLVDGLPTSGHGSKAVAVHDATVYYSLGSSGNREPADRTATPQRATVWRVGLDGSGNSVVAAGVRNGFGLDVAPDGTLFAAVNQMDNQPYPFQDNTDQYGRTIRDYVNENPVDQVSRLAPGTDLGWPYCVPDTRGNDTGIDLPFVNEPVTNPGGQALDCASIPNTMVGLPAHSAPLGLAFTAGTSVQPVLGSGALITAHGSWNRQPPRPPYVAYSPWDAATATLGRPVELVTGFQNDDGSRWGRCVTAIPGPDGSLYVTDDAAGLVYRLTPGA